SVPCLPPFFLAFELYRFLFIIHVVNTKDVVNLIRINNTETICSDFRYPPAPADSKIRLCIVHHRPSGSAFAWGLPADSRMAGVEVRPCIDMVSDLIHRDGIFLHGDLLAQKGDIHQNPSFRLPNRRARSVRFMAW